MAEVGQLDSAIVDAVGPNDGVGDGQPEGASMSFATPLAALSALVVLSLVARERSYDLTSASLLVVAGMLGAGLAAAYWMFG
jgi:hypothetical protein